MRRSRALALLLLGALLAAGGALVAFMTFGAVALGDCSAACVANREREVGIAAGLAALVVAGAGAWLVGYAARAWRARVRELRNRHAPQPPA